jgi:hypothetical protein
MRFSNHRPMRPLQLSGFSRQGKVTLPEAEPGELIGGSQ